MAEITNDLGTFPVPYYTRSQRLLPITKVTREKIVREIVKKIHDSLGTKPEIGCECYKVLLKQSLNQKTEHEKTREFRYSCPKLKRGFLCKQ